MPGAARLGDPDTGHGCWPPRGNSEGSPNVMVNGIPWHRLGDSWPTHACPPPVPASHDGSLGSGSSTVLVNGKGAGRIGDSVSCGGVVASGSANVIAGG